jgi:hypothetical protein
MTELDQIKMRIGDLDQALETNHPGMFNYLKLIHQQLMKMPELVHMLTNEERSKVIKGLEVKTGESITTPKLKTPKAAKGGSIADFL